MRGIKRSFGRGLFFQRLGAAALAVLFCTAPAAADYPIQAGDVVEVSIGGLVDFHQRAVVQQDGTINFPQLGTISVDGSLASQLRAKIQAALVGKTIRQRSSDGRTLPIAIEPDDVAASIVEYRPVYVMGDVSKPGQYAFNPAMTTRQAVAMAGGYDTLHMGSKNSFLLASDVQSEISAVMVQLAGLALRETRVRAELSNLENMGEPRAPDVQVPATTFSALVRTEQELFKTHRVEYSAEKEFLDRSIKQSIQVVEDLNKQLKQEAASAAFDEHDLEDLRGLQGKGYASKARVSETRHSASMGLNRRLQLYTQLDAARTRNEESQKQLVQLESQRKIKLLETLKDCTVQQVELRSKLNGLREKLRAVSTMHAQTVRGTYQSSKIVVIRKGHKGRERLPVDEDFELHPADVVEVTIGVDDASGVVAGE
jgi:polysaccharide biosynthesis/export protein